MRSRFSAAVVSALVCGFAPQALAASSTLSGPYLGVVGSGAMFSNTQQDHWCDYACDAPSSSEFDAAIGATAGYNWIEGNALLGIEADISTGFGNEYRVYYDTPPNADGAQWSADWDWLSTIRARAGLTQGNTTVFATAGVAIAGVTYEAREIVNDVAPPCDPNDSYDCARYSSTEVGIALGAGVEVAMWDGASVKLEYLYVGLPDARGNWDNQSGQPDEFVNWTSEAHMARVGVNFALN